MLSLEGGERREIRRESREIRRGREIEGRESRERSEAKYQRE